MLITHIGGVMMNHQDILNIALKQSAIDLSCQPEDFLKQENVVVISKPNAKARRYLQLPFFCQLVTYGNNIVASCDETIKQEVQSYINQYPTHQAFETPNLLKLNQVLNRQQMQVHFMAEYFLPDLNALKAIPCQYETRILHQNDFKDLYKPQWSNALCEDRKHLDILGVGAYDDGVLIGLAACSMDGEDMWQIGIDVLEAYRHQGIASSLTSLLALEILKHNKVPFYCCAWANVASARNAIKAGFRPSWMELTAKPIQKDGDDK